MTESAPDSDDDAEGDLVEEQVRAALLGARALALAAYCGSPSATKLVAASSPPTDVEEWTLGLARWGREPLIRAAITCADAVLPWTKPTSGSGPSAAVDAMKAFLAAPSIVARELTYEAANYPAASLLSQTQSAADSAVSHAADAVWYEAEEGEDALSETASHAGHAARYACEVLSPSLLRRVLSRALLLWIHEFGQDWDKT